MYYQILLVSGASASIVRKDVLNMRHKIIKDKMDEWSTMAGTFNTTFISTTIKSHPKNLHKMPFYR